MQKSARLLPHLAWLLLATQLAHGQFYYPDSRNYGSPAERGLQFEEATFQSKDGTKLHGWFMPAGSNALGTVIHLHGNAQNMSAHLDFVSWLPAAGFNLFTFDYRGYGKSGGKPSRRGVHEDALAAIRHVQSRTDLDPERLLILGQSLGGAVCIAAAGSTNIAGLRGVAVDSTFESYEKIAMDKAPAFLARLFISDKFSPAKVVTRLSPTPLLVLHGTSDNVVPYKRGKALYDMASEPKTMLTINGGRHTDALIKYESTYRPLLINFFKECLTADAKQPGDATEK